MGGQFLLAAGGRGSSPSGWLYLPVFGSGPYSALVLEAATLHSFSFFPSFSHVCAASEQPPSSETPKEILEKKKDISQLFFFFFYKR